MGSILLILLVLGGGLAISGGPDKLIGKGLGSYGGAKAARIRPAPKAKVVVKTVGDFCRVTMGMGGHVPLTDQDIDTISIPALSRVTAENTYGKKHCGWRP